MRAEILRCDLCGHDSNRANPVLVHLSQCPEGPVHFHEHPYTGAVIPCQPAVTLDLCSECGRGLLAMLRTAAARRSPTPQPAAPTVGLEMIRQHFSSVLGRPVMVVNLGGAPPLSEPHPTDQADGAAGGGA